MSSIAKQTCETCVFYKAESGNRAEDHYGECLRYPPQIVVIPGKAYEGRLSSYTDQANASLWPVVDYTSWCGEWKPVA
jgi:hypothetical protein